MKKKVRISLFMICCTLMNTSSVFAQCNAAFTTIVTPGFTAVQFFDASTGATSWNWDFGDGTSSAQQNPVHNYPSTGTYTVCLSITGGSGCTDSICQPVTVPAQGACGASLTVQSMAPGYIFTATATGASPFLYTWNFGDGTVFPSSPINTINYIYPASGTYNACVTITDANGCIATSCQTVSTGTASCPPTFVSNVTPQSGTVFFLDATTATDPVVSWSWDFGDGTSSSGSATVTHTYQQSGTYSVCLTIVTLSGCSGTSCSPVTVSVPAACSASFTHTASNTPLSVDFVPTVTPSGAIFFWDFGDGGLPSFGVGAVPITHAYSAPGSYPVCLTVQDGLCSDTFCTTVSVAATAGIISFEESGELKVFPNPANVSFFVRSESDFLPGGTMELIDATGRSIRTFGFSEESPADRPVEIRLEEVPAGIYLVRCAGTGYRWSARIAVVR